MSKPASPSSSPSKETPNENDDGLWEEAFANMDEQEPLFQKLPTTEADAMKVFEKFNGKSHIGPIVLAKGILQDVFSDWLGHSELGLHKSERLVNGTIYIPQTCAIDHGILRGLLGNPEDFPILSRYNATGSYLKTGSGSIGGLNPDVFWWRTGEATRLARVLFEVGIEQSLPDLRRRAETLCSGTTAWENLQYVVLIKRYKARRIYVEIWRRRNAPIAGVEAQAFDQGAPGDLGVSQAMEFLANAHAASPNAGRNDAVAWQFELLPTCSIPAGDSLLVGGAAVTFDARTFLNKCYFEDLE
jgi:hypothetical protein